MPISLYVDRQKDVECVADVISTEDVDPKANGFISRDDLLNMQVLLKKLQLQKVLGITRSMNNVSVEGFLEEIVVPTLEEDFVQEDVIKSSKEPSGSEVRKLKDKVADLKMKMEALKAENLQLQEELEKWKVLSKTKEEKIIEMRKFYYKDKSHLTAQEKTEIERLTTQVEQLTKDFLRSENKYYESHAKMQKLKKENESLQMQKMEMWRFCTGMWFQLLSTQLQFQQRVQTQRPGAGGYGYGYGGTRSRYGYHW